MWKLLFWMLLTICILLKKERKKNHLLYLEGRETETEGPREFFQSLVYSHRAHTTRLSQAKSISIEPCPVCHMGGRDTSVWTLISCFLELALAGSWIRTEYRT